MKNAFVVTASTRPTGHMHSICSLDLRTPILGVDYGLANVLAYQSAGNDFKRHVKVVTLKYNDGMILPIGLADVTKIDSDTIRITHVHHDGTETIIKLTEISNEEELNDLLYGDPSDVSVAATYAKFGIR